MTREDLRMFSVAQQEDAIQMIKSRLPDEATLLQLGYTGGRAFGWGPSNTDIDLRGFYEMEDWFTKCHIANVPFDGTIRNVYDRNDPQLHFQRWNMYYDFSKTFYVDDSWDYDAWMDHCSPSTVEHAYPHNIDMQLTRMKKNFQARSACHSYKEVLIPLHYLRTGEIENNVNKILEAGDYDVQYFKEARDTYMESLSTNRGLDEEATISEVKRLFEELGVELAEQTDYNHEKKYPEVYPLP